MAKQRNESCEVYKKAGRKDLLESETREIEVINTFLPQQLTDEEAKKLCEEVIKKAGRWTTVCSLYWKNKKKNYQYRNSLIKIFKPYFLERTEEYHRAYNILIKLFLYW